MPKTYTVKEVADILGFSTNSIYTFLKEKRIKGVRIGRGRFRIPEEELSRILHLSKKPVTTAVLPQYTAGLSASSQFTPTKWGDAAFIGIEQSGNSFHNGHLLAPNIFDWFIGLAAVVSGTGLFLFNATVVATGVAINENMFLVARVILVVCGMGIILSSFVAQTKKWNSMFHLLLAVIWGVSAYGMTRAGDMDGVAIYGGLSIVIALHTVLRLGGIVTLMAYVSLLAVAVSGVIIVFPSDTHIQLLSAMVGVSPLIIGFVSLAISVVFLFALWVGYLGNHALFTLVSWALAIFDVLAASWYAQIHSWSRAFFIVVVGYFTAFLPYWWRIQQETTRRYRIVLHGLFTGIGVLLISTITVVSLLQRNVWDQRQRDLSNKITVATNTIMAAITSVKSSLSVVVKNADFVRAMSSSDIETLTVYSKVLYESNPNIRRLVYLDATGEGIAIYPYGTFSEPNLAYRDYFQKAKTTGLPYISDVFLAHTNEMSKYVVVVSVPVYRSAGVFAGVITASVDLARLGLQLSDIASADQNETFVIADSKGTILIHPDASFIGTTAPKDDVIYTASEGAKKDVMEGKTVEGMTGLVAYAPIPELRWVVKLRIPVYNAYLLTSQSVWIIFGATGGMIMASVMFFVFIRQHIGDQNTSGP